MEHKEPYTSLSDIVARARGRNADAASDCQKAISLIEQLFCCIDRMNIDERDALMRSFTGWVIGKAYGAEQAPVLVSLHRYCVAVSINENSSWLPPKVRL